MTKSKIWHAWLEYCLLCRYYWRGEIGTHLVKTWLRIAQYALTGLAVSFTYYGAGSQPNARAATSVISISRFFMTVVSLPFLSKFLKEDRRRLRDGFSGLAVSAGSLLLAKFTVYLGLQGFLALIYSIIVYPLTDLRGGVQRAIIFIIILWAHQFAKGALGFLISAGISHGKVKSDRLIL